MSTAIRKKILLVFGTRPEAIKMAPLVNVLNTKGGSFVEAKVCVTRQHQEMLDQILGDFNITPDFTLPMPKGLSLNGITSFIINEIKPILQSYKPDLVLVHGDTTTSFAAALACFYEQIDVGHVEAGLRTHNTKSPWPEEMNRQLTARLSKFHFAPTLLARENLIKEDIPTESISLTGNTVIDALFMILKKINTDSQFKTSILNEMTSSGYLPNDFRRYILVTTHRRENHGDGIRQICLALQKIALENPSVDIVLPVHLNPIVKNQVTEILGNIKNVFLISPLNYSSFVYLMGKAYLILTDSGGIQEEAPSLNIPVLVLRHTTERPEALRSGAVKLIGTEMEKIYEATSELLNDQHSYQAMTHKLNPYGDGKASQNILDFLRHSFIDRPQHAEAVIG